jgi:hypothetical protein
MPQSTGNSEFQDDVKLFGVQAHTPYAWGSHEQNLASRELDNSFFNIEPTRLSNLVRIGIEIAASRVSFGAMFLPQGFRS